jgi:hypothetical protein
MRPLMTAGPIERKVNARTRTESGGSEWLWAIAGAATAIPMVKETATRRMTDIMKWVERLCEEAK